MTAATTTAAQNTFWRKLRAHVDGLPLYFTPGKYRCPAHDDNARSLKVDYRDNSVRLYCFSNNCSGQAVSATTAQGRPSWTASGPAGRT